MKKFESTLTLTFDKNHQKDFNTFFHKKKKGILRLPAATHKVSGFVICMQHNCLLWPLGYKYKPDIKSRLLVIATGNITLEIRPA